ncbi:MAG: cryptochrome/photolyase family protein [Caulobacteraceae bacterium]
MNSPDAPVMMWFRRDLRLADNPALAEAAAFGRPIIPVFVLDEADGARPLGGASKWWLDKSVTALGESLKAKGSRLILRRGDAAEIIPALAAETGAGAVIWNRLYDPHSVERDKALKARLKAAGIEARSYNAALLNEPWKVATKQGTPFKVFTPYWRGARARIGDVAVTRAPAKLRAPERWPRSDDLADWRLHPARPDWSPGFDWTPGEEAAHEALDRFLDGAMCDYTRGRDRPDLAGTSRLSPHLAWGEIGPRQVWRRVQMAAGEGRVPDAQAEKFLGELGWREFNTQLLFHFPHLATRNLNPRFDTMAWREPGEDFEAWTRGQTGYPAIDAAMRQLWTTGWMHNRMRMAAASFLIKDLLIDWRVGEAWFWDTLVDADPANNAANWQWVAGSGADAQPFFRIFNPVSQGERFDPHGAYVRRWVPVLAALPSKAIHAPWTARAGTLDAAGVRLGETYPEPVVNHAEARERALEAFRALH